MTRTQYFKMQVEESLDDIASKVEAIQVYVDDCNDFSMTKPFNLTAVFLGVGAVLLLSAIFLVVSVPRYLQMQRRKKQDMDLMDEENEGYEPHHDDENFA